MIDRWASPWAFLLVLLAPVVMWLLWTRGRSSALSYPGPPDAAPIPGTWRTALRWTPWALRGAALVLLAVAIARPQSIHGVTRTTTEGIAIQLVVDRSGSMNETMPTPSGDARKMDVVKDVLVRFVDGDENLGLKGREGDLVGLVGFARYADTFCPLLRSHEPVVQFAKDFDTVPPRSREDGTAIGEGLALAAARLRSAEDEFNRLRKIDKGDPGFQVKSKIIVLVTDGVNNAGDVDPMQAAALAKEWGIKIYTIGVGSQDVLVQSPFGVQRMPIGGSFDDEALRRISAATGGKSFVVTSAHGLVDVVKEIDSLERSKIESVEHVNAEELFMPYAQWALIAVALELALSSWVFRSLP